MYGLEAINANNGWHIAAVGIIIVFAGLVSLSLIISQLHKVLAFIANPERFKFLGTKKNIGKEGKSTLMSLSKNQKESAKQFFLLVKAMEKHFSLPKLLRLAELSGFENQYNNFNILLDSGIIEPDTEGYFLWNEDRFKELVQ